MITETPYIKQIKDHGLTDDNYYNDNTFVTQSSLGYLDRSPMHYLQYLNGNIGSYESDAMRFGTAFHHFVLEPETFDDTYFILDTDNRPEPTRTMVLKANKEWKAQQMELSAGKLILEGKDYKTIKSMSMELSQADSVTPLFSGSTYEEIVVWEHKPTGIKCKGKVDIINREKGFIADVKTARSAQPDNFLDTIVERKYHRQAAFYLDAMGLKDYYIIAIEKTFPFAYCVYKLGDEILQEGRGMYEDSLSTLLECRKSDTYTSYNNGLTYDV